MADQKVAKARGNTGRRDKLIAIEQEITKEFDEAKIFEVDAPSPDDPSFGDGGYLGTFPYPYMNGRLHLGHSFSLTKVEFGTTMQRLLGKKVLFPFGFHCTGMPIRACADKIKREIEEFGNPPQFPPRVKVEKTAAAPEQAKGKTGPGFVKKKGKAAAKSGDSDEWSRKLFQWEIMSSLGIEDSEIPRFADPQYWLDYFPPYGVEDLKQFGIGVDWRRSFITTDVNPYYDSFVRWQYNTMKAKGKLEFGKRPCIYSPSDNGPCADHDRQSGEGVQPQEYTIIKMKVLELPEKLKSLEGRNVYLGAATLRPETMYGQTNCWILPTGEYGAFELSAGGDVIVCSERAARNMSYQGMSPEVGKPSKLADVTGQDLIGCPLKAPNSQFDVIYVLPFLKISTTKGTGVVTSVPSDAPDDYAALRDLKNKEAFRQKYGVKDEWVLPFEVVPIIDVPDMGDTAAVKACDDFKVQSQNDADALQKAKELVYSKGFYEGVMKVGPYAGKMVQDAKPLIKSEMVEAGQALIYSEPEKPVLSRSGDDCVVALTDQWYIRYGEAEWKAATEEHLKTLECFATETRRNFESTLDWLNGWAVSRTYGLGTRLPWDEKYLIDSLSDSTIYMAYYTVAHLLQGGTLEGSAPGPAGIEAAQMTDAVWDYIFLNTPLPSDTTIPEATLQKLRNEFRFWYPVDIRVSGKDLVPNHLTFFLYSHVAIFDKQYWPKAIRANGHIMLNGEKMAKSTGNFLTLTEGISQYSCTALRIGLANAGDEVTDANFEDEVANAAILKLTALLAFIETTLSEEGLRSGPPSEEADKMFANALNGLFAETKGHFVNYMFRAGLQSGFFGLANAKDRYLNLLGSTPANKDLLRTYFEYQAFALAPIAPHFADYVWRKLLGNKEFILRSVWPEPGPVDPIVSRQETYVLDNARRFRLKIDGLLNPKNKKAKKLDKAPESMTIVVAREYPAWQQTVLKIVADTYDALGKAPTMKDLGSKLKAEESLKGPLTKKAMQFAAFIAEQAGVVGRVACDLKTPFDEAELLTSFKPYFLSDLKMTDIRIIDSSAASTPEETESIEHAKPFAPAFFF
eukprot:TRINITY_DN13584_c0_g1_i1.p1 TRINITY_DN13584_c0_g1~~TRINITY_DN13584_c0_g1_i1.p1  ORF type:complete len:1084 (+),score=415.30 TRINITY_DN13584_c0_g1_i1:23-3253(+)